jgi:hypothetical protein
MNGFTGLTPGSLGHTVCKAEAVAVALSVLITDGGRSCVRFGSAYCGTMLRQPYVIKITIHYTLFVPLALKICDQYFLAGVLTMLYQAISKLRDQLRTVFHVRRQRLLPPPGAKPAFGSTITLDRLKMQLFLPIDYEQWEWLTLRGWRTLDSARTAVAITGCRALPLRVCCMPRRMSVNSCISASSNTNTIKKGWNEQGQTATSPQQAAASHNKSLLAPAANGKRIRRA